MVINHFKLVCYHSIDIVLTNNLAVQTIINNCSYMSLYVFSLSYEVLRYSIVVENFSIHCLCQNMQLLYDHGRPLTMNQMIEGLMQELCKEYESIFDRAHAVLGFHSMKFLWHVDLCLGWSSPPVVATWLAGFETRSETNSKYLSF